MRRAFTLIELLVVLALIGVLAALAIYFIPSFQTSERSARGAGNLQSWLQSARLRAQRDQAPRGLRIMFDPATGLASKAMYLVQPDELASQHRDAVGTFYNLQIFAAPDNDLRKLWIKSVSEKTGIGTPAFDFGANFSKEPVVQAGDYIELDGGGLPRMIVGCVQSDPMKPAFDVLVIASPLPEAITAPVRSFKVQRAPRITGDEVMELPNTIVVDSAPNVTYAASLPFMEPLPADAAGNVDIMFSPTGAVLRNRFSKPDIRLWVRSTDYPGIFDGEPTLIVVYINSGLVAAYPVNSGNQANPYDLVK